MRSPHNSAARLRRPLLGGAVIGKGGMGIVHTLDFLTLVNMSCDCRLVTLSNGGQEKRVTIADVSKFVNTYEKRMVIKANFPHKINKDLHLFYNVRIVPGKDKYGVVIPDNDYCKQEMWGNLKLVSKIMTNDKLTETLTQYSPFYVLENGNTFAVGIEALDKKSGLVAHTFPIYRRMMGDVRGFYNVASGMITLRHILDVIQSTLFMLKVMQGVDANHLDIKEENILFDIHCPNRSVKPTKTDVTEALYKPNECVVKFVLSDFGLIMFEGDRLENGDGGGTPGFIGPSRYTAFGKDGKDMFIKHFQKSYLSRLKPEDIWKSYNLKKKYRDTFERYEKSDLYVLGLMLYYFNIGNNKEIPGGLRDLREFAKALMEGRDTDIWSIDEAFSRFNSIAINYREMQDTIYLHVNNRATIKDGKTKSLMAKQRNNARIADINYRSAGQHVRVNPLDAKRRHAPVQQKQNGWEQIKMMSITPSCKE
jgi:serine/threonine protein kinase